MNFILGIDGILNVWANDAHKLAVFISLLYLPFLFYLFFINLKNSIHDKFFSLKKAGFFKKAGVEIVYLMSLVSMISGFTGIGQLYLNPYADVIIRSFGFIFLLNASLLFYILIFIVKDDRNSYFYKTVRHPGSTLTLLIAYGISMIMVNAISALIAIILNMLILSRIKTKEVIIIENDSDYIDYKSQVPALVPNLYHKLTLKITKMIKK